MLKDVFEELVVVKRSGQRVGFNSTKIAIAIKRAFDSVEPINNEKNVNTVYESVVNYINETYQGRKTINVEDIQDIIETKLKQKNHLKVYESFSEYRSRRAASRKAFDVKQQHKFVRAIERIANDNNLNKDTKATPNEILLDFGKTVASEFTKSYILDNKFERAHEEGTIYIHNLDYFGLGKLSNTHLKYDEVLKQNSFPYNILNLVLNAKEEIDGEITISKLDYILVPYMIRNYKSIFKEKLSKYLKIGGYANYINQKRLEEIIDKETSVTLKKEVFSQYILNDQVSSIFSLAYEDSLERMIISLNEAFRELLRGLNYNYKENKKVSISLGTNTSCEGTFINKCFFNELIKLERLENVTVIIKIKDAIEEDVCQLIKENKNIALSFVDSSFNKDKINEVEYFSNGFRIFDSISLEKESIGRMVVASTSVNLSRLGFKYKDKPLKDLYLELDEILELVKNELIMVFETIGDKSKNNYQIIFSGNILDDEKLDYGQKIRKVIKNGVLNIGLVGLKECVINLSFDYNKQKDLITELLKHINHKTKEFTNETKLNFVLSETEKYKPCKDLIAIDKTIYGINKNLTDSDAYSRIDSLFSYREELETDLKYIATYQKLLSGGNLVEISLPKNTSSERLKAIIKIAQEADVGFIKIKIKTRGNEDDN